VFDNKGLGMPGWISDGNQSKGEQKRMMFANLRKAKSIAPDPNEELKDEDFEGDQLADSAANQLNLQLMYGFLNEFQEFAWDPENSSREV
jgi:hypothetical protein